MKLTVLLLEKRTESLNRWIGKGSLEIQVKFRNYSTGDNMVNLIANSLKYSEQGISRWLSVV